MGFESPCWFLYLAPIPSPLEQVTGMRGFLSLQAESRKAKQVEREGQRWCGGLGPDSALLAELLGERAARVCLVPEPVSPSET